MKLDLIGYRITKNELRNEMTPNMKLNLQVSMAHQINLPKEFTAESVGTVITRVMVGNPLQPLYVYMEQVSNFKDVDKDMEGSMDREEAMSLFKMICVPVAVQQVEKNLNELCKIYHIPEFKLGKAPTE